MLRVMLVDDEPFILQGLKILIDWEEEGFTVVKTAADGAEALEYLKEHETDLIIADVSMPEMTGIELLKRVKSEGISEAFFVILSGYADFSYAQQAMRYNCTEYVLKPVIKEELLRVLREVTRLNRNMEVEHHKSQEMERAYLERCMLSVLRGKYDEESLAYVKNSLKLMGNICYVEIEPDGLQLEDELSDEEKSACQKKLHQCCLDYLGSDGKQCFFDVSGEEKVYDVGLILDECMLKRRGIETGDLLEELLHYLKDILEIPIVILVGKTVPDLGNIAKSYSTVCIMRSIQGFRPKQEIYYYEEGQVKAGGILLCKKSLDNLIKAIEHNDGDEIFKYVDEFYEEMRQSSISGGTMNLNVNYLLFQLVHLASAQDNQVNQEEILRFISESSFEEGLMRGSKDHIAQFACKYALYLAQLRGKMSHGILADIEREIKENYAKNLTLKGFSEKYFINSAYLGQLFRKQYGLSFKDYLNSCRMEQAAGLLLQTDQKIYQIAEAVGYHDLDYFVSKFIAAKGCTPARFRKQGWDT